MGDGVIQMMAENWYILNEGQYDVNKRKGCWMQRAADERVLRTKAERTASHFQWNEHTKFHPPFLYQVFSTD